MHGARLAFGPTNKLDQKIAFHGGAQLPSLSLTESRGRVSKPAQTRVIIEIDRISALFNTPGSLPESVHGKREIKVHSN